MMILRLYWFVGSLTLAWLCRDSEVLSMLFLLQVGLVRDEAPRHPGIRASRV